MGRQHEHKKRLFAKKIFHINVLKISLQNRGFFTCERNHTKNIRVHPVQLRQVTCCLQTQIQQRDCTAWQIRYNLYCPIRNVRLLRHRIRALARSAAIW